MRATRWTEKAPEPTQGGAGSGGQPRYDGPEKSENGDCEKVGAVSCGVPPGAGGSVEEPATREETGRVAWPGTGGGVPSACLEEAATLAVGSVHDDAVVGQQVCASPGQAAWEYKHAGARQGQHWNQQNVPAPGTLTASLRRPACDNRK